VVLLLGSPNRLGSFSLWPGSTAGPPAYREVAYTVAQPALGRDVVISPDEATAERIEWLVATMAAADPSPLLRLNVFTSEAAARRRRELIAAGVYVASDAEEAPDPPEWAEVHPAWVGIYTRDPANGVHQLSICLNDPDHSRCAVRRYP
jgi:hypothetical protein